MKKSAFILIASIAFFSFSFIIPSSINSNDEIVVSDVQFKVINDTGAAFDYFANNQHLSIPANQVAGFSYPEGTVIYKWTNGAQGDAWFTVSTTMHGQSFQLSQLLGN